MKARHVGLTPIQRAASRQCNRTAQEHCLSGEEAEMFRRFVPTFGLVERAAIDADDAVAADHPLPGNTDCLCASELKRDLTSIRQTELELVFVNLRSRRQIVDPRGIEHLASDRTG